MANMKFGKPSDKLADARRCLMLPHPDGEVQSIAHAFDFCRSGFDHLNPEDLDDNALRAFTKIKELMDTSQIQDPGNRGTFFAKASVLSVDDKYELSKAVDDLAHWLEDAYWERH